MHDNKIHVFVEMAKNDSFKFWGSGSDIMDLNMISMEIICQMQ